MYQKLLFPQIICCSYAVILIIAGQRHSTSARMAATRLLFTPV